MYIVCCIILAAYGLTTVRNEVLVQIYSGLKFGDAAKNKVKQNDDTLYIIGKLTFISLVYVLI